MRPARVLLLSCCVALGLAGRAHALFDDDEARRRIEVLRSDVSANQKQVQEQLKRIEAAVQDRSTLIDLAGQIDALRQEITRLNGQAEVLMNRADRLERRQTELYADLEGRLRKMEDTQSQSQQNLAALQERIAGPEREAAQEKQAYEAALNQFKVGNYQSAIAGFQGFMGTYPNSALVPSAQYWIGNAYYALRDYKVAIAAQQKVVVSWPDNPKAADAMLNIASSQQELGDSRAARETLKTLLTKYPQSAAAEQAKQRLGGRR